MCGSSLAGGGTVSLLKHPLPSLPLPLLPRLPAPRRFAFGLLSLPLLLLLLTLPLPPPFSPSAALPLLSLGHL